MADELDAVLLRYSILHVISATRKVLGYMVMDTSCSGRKAVRIMPDSCVTFLLDRQGHSGEGWTGGGTEIPGRQGQEAREGAQHNATQRKQITSKHKQHPHVHTCGSHETQLDSDNIHPLGI